MTTVTITGLKELSETLKQLPAKVAKRVLKKGVSAGASLVRKAAKEAAPTSKAPRRRGGRVTTPGTLKRAAITKFVRQESNDTQVLYIVTFRKGKKQQKKERDAYYASWVEFGHKVVQRRGKGKGSFAAARRSSTKTVPGKRFLTGAFNQNGEKAVEVMKKKMSEELARMFP